MASLTSKQRVSLTILVAALGYFVDVFDLQLFSMLRLSSLKSFGLSPEQITSVGVDLLNWQMAGMLLGGILWGMLGDKRGRVYVLFGTILLYSIGNIANGFVHTIPAYAAARFITGFGLAGEIGAGITLASELLPKSTRGYGSTVIVGVGVVGPLFAGFLADAFDWRTCYICGGVLGLALLALRVAVNESGLYSAAAKQGIARGHFRMLFNNSKRFKRYLACIGIGIPIWFLVGIIVIFSPEIATGLGIEAPVKATNSVISYYIGITLGGFISGLISQIFKNRKKVIAAFILGLAIMITVIFSAHGITAPQFYALVVAAGFCTGYWTLFLTTTSEQFGTNIRATATSSVPNFVRGTTIINTLLVSYMKPTYGFLMSAEIVGIGCFVLAAVALWFLPETFGRDLDFNER
ncbi:MAG TPA: MFS transporter [Alphaproteobacteria bacterium]|nr:MFS transporter [Alphaproteobacteria bacterium]